MPTPSRSANPSFEFAFRPADPAADEDILFALFRDARAPEFASLDWEEKRLLGLLRTQYEAQRADYARRFPTAEQRLAFLGSEAVALLWVWRSTDQIRLLDIIVSASGRNAGIGAALMRGLQAEAEAAALPLRHMVAVTNAGAIRLYERLGFVTVGDAGSHLLMEWLPTGATDQRPA